MAVLYPAEGGVDVQPPNDRRGLTSLRVPVGRRLWRAVRVFRCFLIASFFNCWIFKCSLYVVDTRLLAHNTISKHSSRFLEVIFSDA